MLFNKPKEKRFHYIFLYTFIQTVKQTERILIQTLNNLHSVGQTTESSLWMWEGQKANGEVYRDRKATILYSINYCTARVSINFITQIHLMPAERRVYLESLDFVFSVERGASVES